MKPLVVICGDGSNARGMGHIYRMLNLADALNTWAEVRFLTRGDEIAYKKLSERYPTTLTGNNEGDYKTLNANRPAVIIIDRLDTETQNMRKLSSLCETLVTFDDCGEGAYEADLTINVLYNRIKPKGHTKFYTDPSYAIINKRFAEVKRQDSKDTSRILVTMGGADTLGHTPNVIKVLDEIPERFDIIAAIGPAFKHYNELEEATTKCRKPLDLRFNITDMWNLMAWADIAISAGGNTLFELASTGTPTIAICEETFEVETADRMQSFGTCISLGYQKKVDENQLNLSINKLLEDPSKRAEMSNIGRKLVDGRGSERASNLIQETLLKKKS
jgi:spore coat polysaccharide biosynthesis predicted glycosyltransferase SpsG